MTLNAAVRDERDAYAAELAAGREIEIGGVLCDMDGTLVDSIPAVEEAWRILAAEYGVPMLPPGMHGLTAQAIIAALGIPADQRPQAEQRLTGIESRDGQQLNPLPGAWQFLTALPAARWGIVTSAARPVARARFGATGLPLPAFVVTGDDVSAGKPAPEPFAKGWHELQQRGAHGVVIALEDTPAGLMSARAAGCLAIGVVGTHTHSELTVHAHHVVASLDRLRSRITRESLILSSTHAQSVDVLREP